MRCSNQPHTQSRYLLMFRLCSITTPNGSGNLSRNISNPFRYSIKKLMRARPIEI